MQRGPIASLLVLAAALVAGDARAQCGAKQSSCSSCHDGAHAPAPSAAAWHRDHAFADVCAVCHGGAPDAHAQAAAHVGVSSPLADVDARCGSCHGAASAALAARYENDADAGAIAPAPAPPEPHGRRGPNLVAVLLAVGMAAGGGAFVFFRARARRTSWA